MKGWIDATIVRDRKEIQIKININNITYIQNLEAGEDGFKTRIFFNCANSTHYQLISIIESYDEILNRLEKAN